MVSQSPGFSYALPYREAAARWPELAGRTVVIGGTAVTCGQAAAALELLARPGGVMVRQALAAAGNPLAGCDYHAAAAPFLARALARSPDSGPPPPVRPAGRGAAGRPVTRTAFAAAVAAALDAAAAAEPAQQFAAALEAARSAFGADERYAVAMADAAVALRERAHAAGLRSRLADAVRQAVAACEARRGEFSCAVAAACGTGDCRLAGAGLEALAVPAGPGRVTRPANHVRAGSGFGTAAASAALAAAVPFTVAVQASGADCGSALDCAAA